MCIVHANQWAWHRKHMTILLPCLKCCEQSAPGLYLQLQTSYQLLVKSSIVYRAFYLSTNYSGGPVSNVWAIYSIMCEHKQHKRWHVRLRRDHMQFRVLFQTVAIWAISCVPQSLHCFAISEASFILDTVAITAAKYKHCGGQGTYRQSQLGWVLEKVL